MKIFSPPASLEETAEKPRGNSKPWENVGRDRRRQRLARNAGNERSERQRAQNHISRAGKMVGTISWKCTRWGQLYNPDFNRVEFEAVIGRFSTADYAESARFQCLENWAAIFPRSGTFRTTEYTDRRRQRPLRSDGNERREWQHTENSKGWKLQKQLAITMRDSDNPF
jgi:hypothetical protein